MLEQKINQDYVAAMKARDSFKSGTLSFLRAQLKNIIIEKRVDKLDDLEVLAVIKKQVKQRQDSIKQYTDGGRMDLVETEQAELDILESYLPEQMNEEQVVLIVKEAVAEVGAASIKDMGAVMKVVSAKIAGQADNRLVSDVVKKVLAG